MREQRIIRLTSNQIEILNQVKTFYIEHSKLPTCKELAKHSGRTMSSAARGLEALIKAGIIINITQIKKRWTRIPYTVEDTGRWINERIVKAK
ncbi:hypothetical protein VPAG_00025 [Vibrio phage douglas 12A4]|uniref:hypothetical protein n=1 Tax=Vibrio phage douglas 12A4 TaxID=573171 RepID=UPI0002C0E3E0|nr:hypothetical protein VPAG_00025 [Vibrio phage douglas 12A4]AGG58061.1 hypothetical protein VPAG_00025 [Vibrio phage douglas 12A4]